MNFTTGNGMAEGCTFVFEDCTFSFIGGNRPAFYTHECAGKDTDNAPSLSFKNCRFSGNEETGKTIMLQSVTGVNMRIPTLIEDCKIHGGIYFMLYSDASKQHYDVTVIGDKNPPLLINRDTNPYPIKFVERGDRYE